MTAARFPDAFSSDEREIYELAGYGGDAPLGRRPALVVVDVSYGFIGDRPEPIRESIKRFPHSSGQAGWDALPPIRSLIDESHGIGAPVYFTTGVSDAAEQRSGGWTDKNVRFLEGGEDAVRYRNRIPDEIAPQPGDVVIEKDKPSAFFGTPLASYLIRDRIDTVLVTGCTTSGCVRATVIDAFSYNYTVVVVEEAVFDRAPTSHAVNLFEMRSKYAQVLGLAETVRYLRQVRQAGD